MESSVGFGKSSHMSEWPDAIRLLYLAKLPSESGFVSSLGEKADSSTVYLARQGILWLSGGYQSDPFVLTLIKSHQPVLVLFGAFAYRFSPPVAPRVPELCSNHFTADRRGISDLFLRLSFRRVLWHKATEHACTHDHKHYSFLVLELTHCCFTGGCGKQPVYPRKHKDSTQLCSYKLFQQNQLKKQKKNKNPNIP